jgi:hypothetical protein
MPDPALDPLTESWWVPSFRADPRGALIADRHYNRQAIGSPQFVPPGRCVVFRHADDALWVSSWPIAEYVKHEWAGAWVNSTFRHESDRRASEIIREAIAHTLDVWPDPPPLGMVTMIDPKKVRHKRDPGRCYLRAGFHHAGWTKGGLRVLQMDPPDMPDPVPCGPKQMILQWN